MPRHRSWPVSKLRLTKPRQRRGEGGQADADNDQPKRSRRKSRTASTIPDIGWKFRSRGVGGCEVQQIRRARLSVAGMFTWRKSRGAMISRTLSRPARAARTEEFFDGGVAESEAADGRRTAVDHDVAAEGRKIAPLPRGTLHVIGVGVVYASRKVIAGCFN